MDGTGMQLVRMLGASRARPSMWKVWLGINIGIGVGVVAVGLLGLLVATHDFKLVDRVDAIRLLTIAVSASYLALSLVFWFYLPALLSATATACFTVATVLSA
jgi:hypothetical protein